MSEGGWQLLTFPRRNVGPVDFSVATLDEAVTAVLDDGLALSVSEGTLGAENPRDGIAVHFANAYTVALADTDPAYAGLLADPRSAVFTDGMPVAWFGRRQHPQFAQIWQRVYGPDVMTSVFARSQSDGPRHYLLGGDPQTLTGLQREIATRWPQARVVGAESPPFRALSRAEEQAQDARIRASGAGIVWVGLGTPKQDWEVARLARSLPIVAMAVGAAFDFLAGTKPQAPLAMQRAGMEWAFRLASEPQRLARRYLWGNPRFVRAAVRDRVKARNYPAEPPTATSLDPFRFDRPRGMP